MRQSSIDVESSAKVKTYVFPDSSTSTSLQESVRCSPCLPGNMQIVLLSRLRASTAATERQGSFACGCESGVAQTL